MKKTFQRILAAALLLYVSFLPKASAEQPKVSLSNLDKIVQKEVLKTKKREFPITGSFAANYASNYIARPGFIPGKGPVIQTLAKINLGNFTFFDWRNRDLSSRETNEIDRGIMYGATLSEYFPDGKLSGRIGYQQWLYPQANIKDNLIEGGLHYSGQVEFDITLSQIIGKSGTDRGYMFHSTLSKTFELLKYEKGSIKLTPMLQAAYLDNLYGANGLTHITPGVELSAGKGSARLFGFLKHQSGFNGMEDKTYCGAGIEFGF